MKKILIIRFSAIGDIVLASPIIRCVKLQTCAEVHFLTKKKHVSILESNPYIDKIISFNNDFFNTASCLIKEKYNYVIDLQSSIRSFLLKLCLKQKFYTIKKQNIEKFLLINFNINLINNHVVERYFLPLKKINIINDHKGLDYFISPDVLVDFNLKEKFIAWCIGASYSNKALSATQIISVSNKIRHPIILLGGKKEKLIADTIMVESKNNKIYNFCGNLSLDESAYLIKKSALVLTNDTGLMHIASAFKKPIISFWGCTKPVLGFTPYLNKEKSIKIVANPLKPPCSKHGQSCKFHNKGCVKEIKPRDIEKIVLDCF